MKTIRAWHFVGAKLRDGSAIPADGVKLRFAGEPIMCKRGLHASIDPFDALQYAPGSTLCLVDCSGKVIEGHDKLVCTERTIVARIDATKCCATSRVCKRCQSSICGNRRRLCAIT